MSSGYKKYMKKGAQKREYPLLKMFAVSFFGMLLVFTVIFKAFSPSVDVSIGDYKQDNEQEEMSNIDGRLAAIQDEDRGRSFSDLMKASDELSKEEEAFNEAMSQPIKEEKTVEVVNVQTQEPIYKVYIGSYTSAEQAKVAKDIIQESGANLNPIVKCIGSNNYTLQVGIFKSKSGAESLLSTIQQNHLPGRIIQEY